MADDVTLKYAADFCGNAVVPGDKSLSHRALIFAALADGRSEFTGLSDGEDVLSTVRCLRDLGIDIDLGPKTYVSGRGLRGFAKPKRDLDCGNSGTTMRLLMGCLAGQNFSSTLIGDVSLSTRPMARVAKPLHQMGAKIDLNKENLAPIQIDGISSLHAPEVTIEVASAQVKSAVLLASLFGPSKTRITGKLNSRDHTERLLPFFGAHIETTPSEIVVQPSSNLHPVQYRIPGDPSSAAFLVAAAILAKSGDVTIDNVALNPTRTGFLRILKRMGAHIDLNIISTYPEPVGSIRARSSKLKGTVITPEEIPSAIDELPLIAVVAAFAQGTTEVRGAEELRFKESDRIEAVAKNLRALGGDIETLPDGFRVRGGRPLQATIIESYHDHRIAMAFAVAALSIAGETTIKNARCVDISFKNFFSLLNLLTRPSKYEEPKCAPVL